MTIFRGQLADTAQDVVAIATRKISFRYPLVELVTAVASILVVHSFGPSPEALGALALTWALIAATGIDFDHQLLPDQITLPLLWLGLLLNLWLGLFASLEEAVIGAIAGYGILWGGVSPVQAADRQGRHGIRRFQAACRAGRVAGLVDAAGNYSVCLVRSARWLG